MSLINLRHLSAPLRSKFQIGAIVILGLLVLIVRWGSVDNSRQSPLPRSAENTDSQHPGEVADLLGKSSRHDTQTDDSTVDPFLNDLVNGNFDRRTRSERKQKDPSDMGALEDIRKSLGLQ